MSAGRQVRLLIGAATIVAASLSAAVILADTTDDWQQQWFDAALIGDLDAITEAGSAGVPVDLKDESGTTALITAALGGHTDVVGYLLERGATVDARAPTGATPLMVAAWQGHLDTVLLLLDKGADPNAVASSNGATALIFAAQEGQLAEVEALLFAGAEVNAGSSGGTTALMIATRDGRTEVVRTLLRAGANVTQQKKSGASALTIAASKGRDDIAKLLVFFAENGRLPLPETTKKADAVPSANKQMPEDSGPELIARSRAGDHVGVRSLLARNAPVNHRNESGETALIVAADGGHSAALAEILLAAPELEISRDSDGATALAIAAQGGQLEAVRALLDAGAQIDTRLGNRQYAEPADLGTDDGGTSSPNSGRIDGVGAATPLILATTYGHGQVVVLLLQRGADPNQRDAFGVSPLMTATGNGDHESAGYLLAAGAGPDAQDDRGKTALTIAIAAGDMELLALLLEYDADPNLPSPPGTLLLSAVEDGNAEAVALLLSHGATLSNSDLVAGTRLQDVAGNPEVLGLLRKAGFVEDLEDGGETLAAEHLTGESHTVVTPLPAPPATEIEQPADETAPKKAAVPLDETEVVAAPDTESAALAPPFDPKDREIVRKLQAMLNEAGFDAGAADGLIGKRTRRAISAYEREIGMAVTGEVSQKIFDRLKAETSG